MIKSKVIADDWTFIDYKTPDMPGNLPLFISRVLAVSKNGRQFITHYDEQAEAWDFENQTVLAKGDYILAWTQVYHPDCICQSKITKG